MIYNFEDLRPKSTYPKYPPYVRDDNDYIETYFYNYYLRNKNKFDETGRILLPIWWTTLAVQNEQINVQHYIDVLPRNMKWFAVSQHDDGIRYRLPFDTVHFGAGGNGGGIPIPLICNEIPKHVIESVRYEGITRDILCSFIGSNTHPIRTQLFNTYKDNKNFSFNPLTSWSQVVSLDKSANFLQATQRSVFALAPRGYGLSSFRLYEIMQLGSIPVYVSDKHWLPWQEELNWNEFCVIIKPEQIPNLYDILKDISEEKQKEMLKKIEEVYPKYFTLEGMCDQILKRL